ncbi:hypothetical protein V8C86DRAFT_916482 [Haematococcus lacustris]
MQFLRALPGALGLILANVVAAPVVRVHAFLPSTVHKHAGLAPHPAHLLKLHVDQVACGLVAPAVWAESAEGGRAVGPAP